MSPFRFVVFTLAFCAVALPALARDTTVLSFGGRSYTVSTVSREFYEDAIGKMNGVLSPLVIQSCTRIIEVPGGFNNEVINYGAVCRIEYQGQFKNKMFCINTATGHADAVDSAAEAPVYDIARFVIAKCRDSK